MPHIKFVNILLDLLTICIRPTMPTDLGDYNGQWAPQHGFWNPECATNQTWTPVYSFGPDEWITRASLTGEAYVSSVTFTTNKQQSLETCGIPATSTTSISVLEGGKLEYVTGMSGCYFDRLQLHWSDFGNFIG
ncbi:hypothetical protein MAR_012676 [Mya arenaria]|uniref:Jacalin-type lectin domain-containing protein n=1 Tax=Mya arenaria TaxID=6604 RepID=A0ABY7FZA1_MYAAR|nr:hypothetical protein MAR_012676 [Mya arenaria]